MKDDTKYIASRRDFIQLAVAGAGALTALTALPSEGHLADSDGVADTKGGTSAAIALGRPKLTQAYELPATSHAGEVISEAHQTLNLDGTWSVMPLPLDIEGNAGYAIFARNTGERLAAQVPGEIHLDLIRAGRMEDPDIGDNARTRCRWPENHSWWYRTEFTLPPDFRQNVRQRLIFDGIDLYGQVFINGKPAGTTKDAFATGEFDVKQLLKDGTNELVVRVTSGMELPRPQNYPPLASSFASPDPTYAPRFPFEVRRFLRKPAYAAYGWDFCDPLPNIGIWRGVRLEGRSRVVIHHLRLDIFIRGKEVSLEGEVILDNLHPWSEIPCVLELRVKSPLGKSLVQRLAIGTQVGHSSIACRIVVPDPQLWWPNGMGKQPLYELTARVVCGDQETDRRTQTLGLRTIELDRSALPEGSRFCVRVNGEKAYCKGCNWAPADLIPARVDAARYDKFIADAKNAHFTMFRVNGVGLYESDDFYDACDRAGILVWQDFTFSVAQYPDHDPEFMALIRNEAESAVRRLRHHPSLALWSANNECAWYMASVWKCDPAKSEEIGGVQIYNNLLPDVCRTYDPVRPYWPGSPFGGDDPNSETSGDTHWYAPSGKMPDLNDMTNADSRMSQALSDANRGRFVSETGVIGPPNMASIREYLRPDEISIDSSAWKIHSNVCTGDGLAAGIRNHYGDPKDLSLPQFVLYGQMYQAQLQGRAVDAMRFRKNDPQDDCQGLLIWSYNDTWGEVGWSIIDHYARRKAAYYWFRRSASPVKVLVRSRDGQLVTRIVNDTLTSHEAVVKCGWIRLDGRANEFKAHSVTIPANGMIEVARAPLPSPAERNPKEWLYAATLRGEGLVEDQALWLLAPHRELTLGNPKISTSIRNGVLEVSSPVYCHGVHLEDDGREVLADNYFELLPNVPRRIRITAPTPSGIYPLSAVMPIT